MRPGTFRGKSRPEPELRLRQPKAPLANPCANQLSNPEERGSVLGKRSLPKATHGKQPKQTNPERRNRNSYREATRSDTRARWRCGGPATSPALQRAFRVAGGEGGILTLCNEACVAPVPKPEKRRPNTNGKQLRHGRKSTKQNPQRQNSEPRSVLSQEREACLLSRSPPAQQTTQLTDQRQRLTGPPQAPTTFLMQALKNFLEMMKSIPVR